MNKDIYLSQSDRLKNSISILVIVYIRGAVKIVYFLDCIAFFFIHSKCENLSNSASFSVKSLSHNPI